MIRKVSMADCIPIAGIYNGYVKNSTATFETEPVSEDGIRRRISDIVASYSYLVYEVDGKITGYCYAHAWKESAAYSKTLETTIYISEEYKGKGIGRMLMAELAFDVSRTPSPPMSTGFAPQHRCGYAQGRQQ